MKTVLIFLMITVLFNSAHGNDSLAFETLWQEYDLKNKISSTLEFRRAVGWSLDGKSLKRSIFEYYLDKKYLSTPELHFLRLATLYSTAPNFRCEHPLAYLFFERQFGRSPVATADCRPWDNPEFFDLSPENVRTVSLIYVEAGSTLLSKFGHLALGFNFTTLELRNLKSKESDNIAGVLNISTSLTGNTVLNGNEFDEEAQAKLDKIRIKGTPWVTTIMAKSLIGINPLQISFQRADSFVAEKKKEGRTYRVLEIPLNDGERTAMLIAINRALNSSGTFKYSLLSSGCAGVIIDLLNRIRFEQDSLTGMAPESIFKQEIERPQSKLD